MMVIMRHMTERQRRPHASVLTHGDVLMEKHIGEQTEAAVVKTSAVNVYGCSEVTFTKKQKAPSALSN